MDNTKRRDLLTAALKLNNSNPIKEEETQVKADILHQQQPYSEKDLPEVQEFADLESL